MKSTRDDVFEIIGDVDDLTLEKILTVGSSRAELCEAAFAAVMSYEMGESVGQNSNVRVDALQSVIEDLLRLEGECEIPDSRVDFPPSTAKGHDYW